MMPRRRLRRPLLVALLCAGLLWPLTAWGAARFLIVRQAIDSPDAIFVLSGPGTYVERAAWAAKLHNEQRVSPVVLSNEGLLSGWSAKDDRNLYFVELASDVLRQRGVPPGDIQIVSDIGSGTYHESLRLCDYAAEKNFSRVLVVTSGYHSRRALWSIQRACKGKQIQIGMDSPPPGWQTPAPGFWWLRGSGWRMVAAEYVKMIYYRLAY